MKRSLVVVMQFAIVVALFMSHLYAFRSHPIVVSHGLVDPHTIVLEVYAREVEFGKVIPYVPLANESITQQNDTTFSGDEGKGRFIYQGVKHSGPIMGPYLPRKDGVYTRTKDKIHGNMLDVAWADLMTSYKLYSSTDSNFTAPLTPTVVGRKTIMHERGIVNFYWDNTFPADSSHVGEVYGWTAKHTIALQFSHPLSKGNDYELRFMNTSAMTLRGSYVMGEFDDHQWVSPAIHLNQIGFLPNATMYAYLSFWAGSLGGIDYNHTQKDWKIIRDDDKSVVATGMEPFSLHFSTFKYDLDRGPVKINLALTDVFSVDMRRSSALLPLKTRLRLVIPGIGCSEPFMVSDDVLHTLMRVILRAFYFQTNGVAIQDSFKGFTYDRPETLTPSQVRILKSNAQLAETSNSDIDGAPLSSFSALLDMATTEACEVTGGWMDAGDWDTRIQHLMPVRGMLMLYEKFPSFFQAMELGLDGVSGKGMPDILQLALQQVEYYMRLQAPNGGVSGGIETTSHPLYGEYSYANSQTWYCYAPDAWSSYQFASTASYMARVVAPFDMNKANVLRDAAKRAYLWANENFWLTRSVTSGFNVTYTVKTTDQKNLAALLLLIDGDNSTVADFEATSECTRGILSGSGVNQVEAAVLYARMDSPPNAALQSACIAQLGGLDHFINASAGPGNAFRGGMMQFLPGIGLAAPISNVIHAQRLAAKATPHIDDLEKLGATLDKGYGANPQNLVYMTGGGDTIPGNTVKVPLRVDSYNTPGVMPTPGIYIMGPISYQDPVGNIAAPPLYRLNGAIPGNPEALGPVSSTLWPSWEGFADAAWPFMNEYTPQSSYYPNLMSVGYYLAAMNELGYAANGDVGNPSIDNSSTTGDIISTSTSEDANRVEALTAYLSFLF